MNTAVIRQSTAGLAEVLLQDPDAAERGVVVGFDARHRSEAFAVEATAVLRAQGIRVFFGIDACLRQPPLGRFGIEAPRQRFKSRPVTTHRGTTVTKSTGVMVLRSSHPSTVPSLTPSTG